MPKIEIDSIDYKILQYLQNDGRISNTELADKVALSPSPCLRRVKSLEQKGVIERYVAIVNPKLVGMPVNVVINVSLQSQEQSQLQIFQQRIALCDEVMECYLMTGRSDYMLRVVVPDLEHYEHFLVEKLTRIPGISNIQSSFALKQLIYKTELPIKY
jgi:Lrp/AsnC family leucine-responsive transcriptional regulator